MTVTDEEIHAAVDGQTVPSAFVATVAAHGDRVALREKVDDGWVETTFAEYGDQVARMAAGLAALGVGDGTRVVMMMRNIPQFHVVDMAAYFCGATPISIYNSSSPEQVAYLTGHCGATVAVVEDIGFLERFLKVRDELPDLAHLVVLNDPDGLAGPDVHTYASLLEHEPVDLEAAAARATPDHLATLIYTSGTTGPPKGVMLTHRNIAWTVESLRRTLDLDSYLGKRIVSYLPMAHIAERMTSHYQQAWLGYEVTSCPDPGQIGTYAREVRPHVMFGVPRVWEKIHAGVVGALAADPEKSRQFAEGVEAAKPIVDAMAWGRATEEQEATYAFLDELAFRGVRELVGLDQLDIAITGAA
ncbi:MAG: AMP-binding protein, partial [Acidimicrobiales bacterium]|nr:AMP-binding protein [Acidimicrobiales bacterium]